MVFNVVARNQDDHTKNISFLMNRKGQWSLSSAYDITYCNGAGWTSKHQMTVNGKTDNFERTDLLAVAEHADIKQTKADKGRQRQTKADKGRQDYFQCDKSLQAMA